MQPTSRCLATIYDRNAEYLGVSVVKLMDNAGKAICRVLVRRYKVVSRVKVQIFCGGGNNGGDGFALGAELLKRKIEIEIILAVPESKIRTAAAQYHFARLPKEIVKRYSPGLKLDGDILVDALLGVGLSGRLRKPFAEIARRLKKARGKLISLDVPTGDLKPELTIALHCSKHPDYPPLATPLKRGELGDELVVPIGIPKQAETHFGPGDVQAYFPVREPDSHKGENGQVVVVGGSETYLGAPVFTALGAVSGGADLVDLFVPVNNFAAVRKFSPNILVVKLIGDSARLTLEAVPSILKFIQKISATLVLGSGLGKNIETQKAVIELVAKNKTPLVLDASAILPADVYPKFVSKTVVFTPHTGEFERLTGERASASSAKKWARKLGATILLKGATDVIVAPDGRVRFNMSGSPLLTAGGTGDALAGLVGALLSRGVEPFEACGLAVFGMGYTAEQLALKYESLTPQLLVKSFPKFIKQLLDFHG